MRRSLVFFALLFALTGVAARPVAAQQPAVDDSFSDEIIDTLGYPELAITVGPDGVDAPTSVAEGYYQVTLLAVEPYVAYVNFMQPPAGLSEEEATESDKKVLHGEWIRRVMVLPKTTGRQRLECHNPPPSLQGERRAAVTATFGRCVAARMTGRTPPSTGVTP